MATVLRRVREIANGGGAPRPSRPSTVDTSRDTPRPGGPPHQDGPPLPDPRDRTLLAQRDVLKAALQTPALAGPVYDALPDDAFVHPAYRAAHQAIRGVGGTASGLSGPALVQAVLDRCQHQALRTLVSELAVETMPTKNEDDTRYVAGILLRLQKELTARQIAEVKSQLQRLSPADDAEAYHRMFGDLLALEQYHRALVDQLAGALG
jgi:DNA primase